MSAQYPHTQCCFRAFGHSQPPQIRCLTRLNHFSSMAYSLQSPCLRLTHVVTNADSRLGMECAGSALSQSHLQRLAVRHFVAHPKVHCFCTRIAPFLHWNWGCFKIRVTIAHVILSEAKNLSRKRHPRGDSSLRSE